MKPLKENPFYQPSPLEQEKAKKEIQEFINCEAEYAELPLFEGVVLTTSIERYKRACRGLKVAGKINIRTTKGRIIACKTKEFYRSCGLQKGKQ